MTRQLGKVTLLWTSTREGERPRSYGVAVYTAYQSVSGCQNAFSHKSHLSGDFWSHNYNLTRLLETGADLKSTMSCTLSADVMDSSSLNHNDIMCMSLSVTCHYEGSLPSGRAYLNGFR